MNYSVVLLERENRMKLVPAFEKKFYAKINIALQYKEIKKRKNLEVADKTINFKANILSFSAAE